MSGSAGAILGVVSTIIGILSTVVGMNRSFRKEREKERKLIAKQAEEDTRNSLAIINSIEELEKSIYRSNETVCSTKESIQLLERNLKKEIEVIDKNGKENYSKLHEKLEEIQRETIENSSELGLYKEFLKNSNISPLKMANRNL